MDYKLMELYVNNGKIYVNMYAKVSQSSLVKVVNVYSSTLLSSIEPDTQILDELNNMQKKTHETHLNNQGSFPLVTQDIMLC